MLRTSTTRNQRIITELEKVCHFIITESVGFKSAYGDKTWENFIQSIHGRQSGTYDLSIPLIIGHLNNDLKSILMPVYYEHVRQCLRKRVPAEKTAWIKRLVYGDESQQVKTVASKKETAGLDPRENDPDYVEKSFINYFHDETNKPIELIAETTTGEDRMLILNEPEVDFIRSILASIDNDGGTLAVPMVIKNLLKYAPIDENYIEDRLDYDELRKELLMILSYDQLVPSNVNKSHILNIVDTRLQGR